MKPIVTSLKIISLGALLPVALATPVHGQNATEPDPTSPVGEIYFQNYYDLQQEGFLRGRLEQLQQEFHDSIPEEQKENIAELKQTLVQIAINDGVTEEDIQEVVDGLVGIQNQLREDTGEGIEQLATHLILAYLDGTIDREELEQLVDDIAFILGSITLTREDIEAVLADVRDIFEKIEMTPVEKFVVMRDIAAIVREARDNHGPIYPYLPIDYTEEQLENLAQLYADLETIRSASDVTEEMVDQLEANLLALSEQFQSDPEAYEDFMTMVALARADGRLSWVDLILLMDDFHALMNASDVDYEDLRIIIGDIEVILEASNVDREEVAQILSDLAAIFREAYANSRLPKPSEQQQANILKLVEDLQQIRHESEIAPEDIAELRASLRAMVDTPPSEESLQTLSAAIHTLAADGRLSFIDMVRLLDNVWIVLKSAGVTPEELKVAIADVREVLAKSNVDAEDIRQILADLEAIVREFLPDFRGMAHRLEYQLAEVHDLENGWSWTPLIGYYHDNTFPWVLSLRFGWMFVAENQQQRAGDSLWMYSPEYDEWTWLSRDFFPTAYMAGHRKWIYFFVDEDDHARGYWNTATGEYIPADPEG